MNTELEQHIIDNCTPINAEELYDDLLEDVSGPVCIGGIEYGAPHVLKEVDPTAYRCGFNDFMDEEEFTEIDGEYYLTDEVDAAIEVWEENEAIEAEEEVE